MNATNRVSNRAVLLAGALLLAALGLVAIVMGAGVPQIGRWLSGGWQAAQDGLDPWSLAVPGGAELPGLAVAGAGAGVLVLVLAVVFMATRGGGRVAEVLRAEGARGTTSVDRSVAEAVVAEAIAARPDVLSARLGSYRVKREPALAVTVTVRKGARLDDVLAAAESAVRDGDALLGRRIPVLVHLSDRGWRDALRGRARVR